MSIIIYTSRQSAGINAARQKLIDRIIFTYKETPFFDRNKILVITPKQNTYQIERELIEKIGEGGLFGVQVMDFHTLLRRIIEEESSGLDIVDEHGRLMLMQKSLTDIKPELKIYASSVEKQGFAEQVVDQISDLKRASISSEMLLDQVENLEGTLLSDKMYDLGIIFEQFNRNLGDDRLDEDDLLIKALNQVKNSSLIKEAQIFFLDYEAIDRNQADFLVQASESAQSLEIALITDQRSNIPDYSTFIAVNDSIRNLKRLAQENHVECDVIELPNKSRNKSLNFLSNELFSYNPQVFDNQKTNASLYNERNPWEEVNRTAQLIAKEVSDNKKNISYNDIAVCMTDSNTYENIIRKVFAQYQIPIFIDDNHKVTDNHFIQSVISALDAVENTYNRSDMISYLKSDFSGITSEEADLMENYIIEAGVRPWEWEKVFKRIPVNWAIDSKTLPKDHRVNEIRKQIVKRLGLLNPKSDEKKDYSFYIKALLRFLEETQAQEILEELSEKMSEAGNQELSLRYRQIWNILLELLEQMETTLGEVETSFADFITVLKTGLSSYEIGVIPENQDAVIIATLDRTKLPEIKSLYLVGANEGKLPKSYPDNSLFSEYDKEKLSEVFQLDQSQVKSRQFLHRLEEINFYTLLTKAQNQVTFLYSTFDQDGSTLLPSRFITVLETIFPKGLKKKPPKLLSILTPERSEVILESLNPEDQQTWKIRKIIHDWRKLNGQDEFRFIEPNLLQAHGKDILSYHNASELYSKPGQPIRVSASRLEQFSNCPFRHFVQYGLRPTEREEYEVRALDTGIVVHEVFDKFINEVHDQSENNPDRYREIISKYLNNQEILKKDCDRIFNEVLEQVNNSNRYKHTGASRYLLIKIKRIIYTSLLIMLKQLSTSDYIPYSMEHSFSEMTDSGVIINGRIDRIDLPSKNSDENAIRVIDYKTGQKKLTYTDLYYGRALQLALYLSEAVKFLELESDQEFEPGGAFYFLADNASITDASPETILTNIEKNYKMAGIYNENIFNIDDTKDWRRAKQTPNKFSEEELKALLDHTNKKVNELTDSLVSGEIGINPVQFKGEDLGCKYCSFKDICRYNSADNESVQILEELDREQFFSLIQEEDDNE